MQLHLTNSGALSPGCFQVCAWGSPGDPWLVTFFIICILYISATNLNAVFMPQFVSLTKVGVRKTDRTAQISTEIFVCSIFLLLNTGHGSVGNCTKRSHLCRCTVALGTGWCWFWIQICLLVFYLVCFFSFFFRFANCVLSQHKPQGEFPLGKYRGVSLLLCRHGKAPFQLQQGKGCSVPPLLSGSESSKRPAYSSSPDITPCMAFAPRQ